MSLAAGSNPAIPVLRDCLTRYGDSIPGLRELAEALRDTGSPDDLIALYDQIYPLVEQALWSGGADFEALLECYQSLFREQEALILQCAEQGGAVDDRYHFLLGIPVADRPLHLKACLESIYQVCKQFGYGGRESGAYDRIQVIVAEDSREPENVRRHQELVEEYRQKGLQVFHYGQDEQYELLQAIPTDEREQLATILTAQPREQFYLKGQGANRNLCYLKFLQLTQDKHKTLYYLIDCDQSLCVNRQTESGEQVVTALNYFYYIDRIFRTTDTLMLTGKLVGDPPVSPSVMAANFLDDVIAFFERLAQVPGEAQCSFHGMAEQPGDAAYHDLGKLFGFDDRDNTFVYRCRLKDAHDHVACLADYAGRLNAFFFGEHLTRKTWYAYDKGYAGLAPARTVYPGNYIANYAGLKYIIPFSNLRLRMSGPTAGRLIAAEIGERFASVNMPNLHRRTTEAGLNDDFRPGVELESGLEAIDLSNEFERQFFGDLMLFSTEAIVTHADVRRPFDKDLLQEVVEQKEHELLELYQQKHDAILEKNRRLDEIVFRSGHWWLDPSQFGSDAASQLTCALEQVKTFISNIEHNFGEQSQAWQQIQSSGHRAQRKQQIIEALMNYRNAREAWDRLFS